MTLTKARPPRIGKEKKKKKSRRRREIVTTAAKYNDLLITMGDHKEEEGRNHSIKI